LIKVKLYQSKASFYITSAESLPPFREQYQGGEDSVLRPDVLRFEFENHAKYALCSSQEKIKTRHKTTIL